MEHDARDALNRAIARLKDGDCDALCSVFEGLLPIVTAHARRLLSDEADADDAAQQALLKLFSRASDFDPRRDVVSWALAITPWEWRTVRRRAERRRNLLDDDGVSRAAAQGPCPERQLLRRELEETAESLLGTLPERDREALARAFGGVAGQPTGATFRKRKSRALERLRAAWRRAHG